MVEAADSGNALNESFERRMHASWCLGVFSGERCLIGDSRKGRRRPGRPITRADIGTVLRDGVRFNNWVDIVATSDLGK
jgi:hypothetical protein